MRQIDQAERRKEMAMLVKKGESIQDVARKYKLSYATVRTACIEHNVSPKNRHPKERLSGSTYVILRELLGGASQGEVKKKTGLSRQRISLIYQHAKEHGLFDTGKTPPSELLQERVNALEAQLANLQGEIAEHEKFKERHEQVLNWAEKHGVESAAEKFGVSQSAVYAKIRHFGLSQERIPNVGTSMKIVSWALRGKSNEEIGQKLDIPTVQVKRVLDRARKAGIFKSFKRVI